MNYLINHALIAIGIQLLTAFILTLWEPVTLSFLVGGIIGSGFYTLRELWQFFIQGKTHNGRFDWGGMFSPIVANGLLILIIYLIF